ncbi:zinc finger imprinted 3-like [Clytia hemisphaerica]|uniref:zinc finger imprinted 3-like n=1 Tax=Clytia hemisphaerica TaxID=252671 RepID=UPI0034D71000
MDQEVSLSDEIILNDQSENEENTILIIIDKSLEQLDSRHQESANPTDESENKLIDKSSERRCDKSNQQKASSLKNKKDKHFKCTECGTLFTRRNDMKKHMNNLHLGIKPHKCETCPKSFAHKGDLNRHTNEVHGKIRSIECELCGKKFARKNQLTKHQKEHDNESERFGLRNLRSRVAQQSINTG